MKFKVGDKVQVNSVLPDDQESMEVLPAILFIEEMRIYAGTYAEIHEVAENSYILAGYDQIRNYNWLEEWLTAAKDPYLERQTQEGK